MLIAICGIDGAGKTTQVSLLHEYLAEHKKRVFSIKQHTQSYYDDSYLNEFLNFKDRRKKEVSAEMALFSAYDRLKQFNLSIAPLLKENSIVLLDRYIFSAYSYSIARGMNIEWLVNINKFLPIPDYTFYVDVPVPIAQTRIAGREKANTEEKNKEFQNQVRNNFLCQPWGKIDNYYIIDGTYSPIEVHKRIIEYL